MFPNKAVVPATVPRYTSYEVAPAAAVQVSWAAPPAITKPV